MHLWALFKLCFVSFLFSMNKIYISKYMDTAIIELVSAYL